MIEAEGFIHFNEEDMRLFQDNPLPNPLEVSQANLGLMLDAVRATRRTADQYLPHRIAGYYKSDNPLQDLVRTMSTEQNRREAIARVFGYHLEIKKTADQGFGPEDIIK